MKNSGKVWVIVLAVLAAVLLVGFLFYMSNYNQAVAFDEICNDMTLDTGKSLKYMC